MTTPAHPERLSGSDDRTSLLLSAAGRIRPDQEPPSAAQDDRQGRSYARDITPRSGTDPAGCPCGCHAAVALAAVDFGRTYAPGACAWCFLNHHPSADVAGAAIAAANDAQRALRPWLPALGTHDLERIYALWDDRHAVYADASRLDLRALAGIAAETLRAIYGELLRRYTRTADR